MNSLNHNFESMLAGAESSFDHFLTSLLNEEIKPIHVEEVGLSMVAVLFLTLAVGTSVI